jgi:hypothetical protein
MAAIVELFTGDSSLQLGREQYIRPMSIGYNWDKIRVGIYYSVQVPSASEAMYITMAYGLTCQSKQWWDAGADMAYTLYAESSLVAAPTFHVDTIVPGSYGIGVLNKAVNQTKVGAVISTGALGGNYPVCVSYTMRGMFFTDISRQTGQLVFQPWLRGADPTDQLVSDFLVDMESETGPIFCGQSSSAGAVSYSGTGLLDSFWCYWGQSIPVISLHAIAVCRFY